jgi:hypothetical protein
MASNTAPVVDRIRIIPRPDDFLDRNVGSSGEVFFDKQANTLRLYSGKLAGGYSLLTSGNLSQQLADSGIALLEKTVTVGVDTVNGQASGVFYIDGVEKPQLEFVRGYTYLFDQSGETNNSYATVYHPLMFSLVANGGLVGGGHYNDGVVYLLDDDPVTMAGYVSGFKAATSRKVLVTVKSSAPDTLYYWCHFHTNQGNEITVSDPGTGSGAGGASVEVSDTAPTEPTQGTIWFDSSNGKIFVYVTDEDSSQWVQPTVPLPPVNTFKNISVTGGSTLVASGNADTVNFAPGSNITLSVTPATNTITINSSGGGGSSYDQNLNTTDDVTFDDITATGILTASSINAAAIQNTGVGNPTFTSASTIDFNAPDGIRLENILKTNEVLTNITGATGTVIHNYSAGPIFNVTTPAANWTANITNVPTTNDRATNTAIVITQGATPYAPSTIQIDGVTQTIKWIDNVAPVGNANKTDVITLSMLRIGNTWSVLGSYVNYG